MPAWLWLYRLLVVPMMMGFAFLAFPFSRKIRNGFKLRMKPLEDIPLGCIWVHASSGEYEYAKPLIRKLSEHPGPDRFVTYFSPSYVKAIANDTAVDGFGPLPLDLPGPTAAFLDKLKPVCCMISRTDFWPEMLFQCRKREIPIIAFSVTQKPVSGWASLLGPFKAATMNLADLILCVTEEDKKNLRAIGVTSKIEVAGDTRFDQVIYRSNHPRFDKSIQLENEELLTIVAGSTWPEDESVLLGGLAPMIRQQEINLIIAPHEPSLDHFKTLNSSLKGVKFNILSDFPETIVTLKPGEILYVDKIGVLADIYARGDVSFVGGSFKSKVHSVMEPLAHGAITIVGPHISNNREATVFQKVYTEMGPAVQVIKTKEQLLNKIKDIHKKRTSMASAQMKIISEVQKRAGAVDIALHHLVNSWYK